MWASAVAHWCATGYSDREISELLDMNKQSVAARSPRVRDKKES